MTRSILTLGFVMTAFCSVIHAQGPKKMTMAAYTIKIKDVSESSKNAIVTVEIKRLALTGPTTGAVTGDFFGIANKEGPVTVNLAGEPSVVQLHFERVRNLNPGETAKLIVYFH